MIYWILASLLLFFFQTLLPPLFRYILRSDPQVLATLGARDDLPVTSTYGARSERALRNLGEALVIFLPLALLTQNADNLPAALGQTAADAVFGAQIFVLARIAYLPAYLLGIPIIRSVIWSVGVVGLAIMALTLTG